MAFAGKSPEQKQRPDSSAVSSNSASGARDGLDSGVSRRFVFFNERHLRREPHDSSVRPSVFAKKHKKAGPFGGWSFEDSTGWATLISKMNGREFRGPDLSAR